MVEYRTPDYGKIGIGTDEVMGNWSKVKEPFKGLGSASWGHALTGDYTMLVIVDVREY